MSYHLHPTFPASFLSKLRSEVQHSGCSSPPPLRFMPSFFYLGKVFSRVLPRRLASIWASMHACMHACTTYALSGITHFFCTRKKRKKKQWWMDLDFTKLTPRSTCEAYSHDFRVGKCSKNQNPRWTGTSSTPIYSHTIFGCEYYCMLLP